jgi:CRP-like cAMP-binding protein
MLLVFLDFFLISLPYIFMLITELIKNVKGVPRTSQLKAGDYFGQEVILDQQKYGATVVSLQTTTGWKIDRTVLKQSVDPSKLKRSSKQR